MNNPPDGFSGDIDLAPAAGGGHAEPGAEGVTNPLLFAHRLLRGRYKFAVPLAILLAVPGALVGYNLLEPKFESTGMIHVRPTLPRLLYETPENELPPMFDSFMDTQASFLQSRRVLDRAVADPRLQQAGWPGGGEGVASLQSVLSVARGRSAGNLINVSVSHVEPVVAQTAVNAVIDAYQELYGEQDGLSVTATERKLVEREATLDRELQTLRERIFQLADEYGAETLDSIHASRVAEMERLDQELTRLEIMIADAQQRVTDAPERSETVDQGVTPEQAAALDPQLTTLIDQRLRLESRRDSLSEKYGPQHRMMRNLEQQIQELRTTIEKRTESLMQRSTHGENGELSIGDAIAAANPEQLLGRLRARREQFKMLHERVSQEAITLGRKRLQIDALKEQAVDVKEQLDVTRSRLEALRVESSQSQTGRVSIAQRGDLPVSPSNDRRVPLAAAGACAGIGLSFGVFGLVGFMTRGYRYIGDLDEVERSVPLLGTLPDLSGGDAESDELAALSVHQLRNVLQLRSGGRSSSVYTITSATSGDGKTSLTLALGMSFAVSGRKTLLVDADLVGRGLTHELGLDGADGLCQAVHRVDLNGELHRTRVDNLYALPAGAMHDFEPEMLSHQNLSSLIDRLRTEYDTVLIDTGPLLVSLEATLVSVLCDSVILTIARGRSQKLVNASIERLERLGARCAGLVFNRAETQDLERSVSHFSFHSQSLRSQPRMAGEMGHGRSSVLMRAVKGDEDAPKLPDAKAP